MDERLTELMQNLGDAIDQSVRDSETIAAAIGEIKQAGYQVVLVLEATIVFNKSKEGPDADIEAGEEPDQRKQRKPSGEIKITKKDQSFLGDMKISWGDNDDESSGEGGEPESKKKKK